MRPSLLVALALGLTTVAAHADTVYTLTGPTNTYSFTLPTSPSPSSNHSGEYFYIDNVVVTENGTTSLLMDIEFLNSFEDGGIQGKLVGGAHYLFENEGPQMYSGSESNPTLLNESFTGQPTPGFSSIDEEDFKISAVATTPEPSSIGLLGTGLLGLIGVARKRFA